MFKNNLAKNIKNLRLRDGLTQSELSEKLGITRQSLSNYEKGVREPDIAVLTAIANYFNCSVDFLLFDRIDKNLEDIYDRYNISELKNYDNILLKYMLDKKNELKIINNNINSEIKKLDKIIELITSSNSSEHSTELSHGLEKNIIKITIPIIKDDFDVIRINSSKNFNGYINTYLKDPLCLCKKDDYFIFTVKDDSMNKIFSINEKIIMEHTTTINSGDIGLVLINDSKYTIKKIYISDGYIKLIPLSTNLDYKEEIYDLNKIDVKIQGKYIVRLDDYL